MSEPANGEYTSNGRPLGYSSLTPFLAVTPAREALKFYCEVFGATVVGLTEFGDVLAHAELDLGNGRLQLGEPSPEYHLAGQSGTDESLLLDRALLPGRRRCRRARGRGRGSGQGAADGLRLRRPLRQHP